MIATLLLWLAFHPMPCPTCQGKGWYLQYPFVYEVAEPERCVCYRCGGSGWNAKPKKGAK